MKVELSIDDRAYLANLLRIRATRQRQLASERSASSTRQELETEAARCDDFAVRLDDATEPASVSDKEPIRLPNNTRLDINSVDKPTNGHGKEAGNG